MRYRCRSASGSRYSYLHNHWVITHTGLCGLVRHEPANLQGVQRRACSLCDLCRGDVHWCYLQALYLQAPSSSKAQSETQWDLQDAVQTAKKETHTANEAALKGRTCKTQSKPRRKRLKPQLRQSRQHSKAERSQARSPNRNQSDSNRNRGSCGSTQRHRALASPQPLPGNRYR